MTAASSGASAWRVSSQMRPSRPSPAGIGSFCYWKVSATISIDGRPQRLVPRVPVQFSGDADASILAPTAGLTLNLMARRGVAVALDVRSVAQGHVWGSRTPAVFVLEGQIVIASQAYLQINSEQVAPTGDAEHEHDDILAACEANDPVRASEATRQHLQLTVSNVTTQLQPDGVPQAR